MPDPADIPVTPGTPVPHPAVVQQSTSASDTPVDTPAAPTVDPVKGLQDTVAELTEVVQNQAQVHANEMAQLRQMATPQVQEPTPTANVSALRDLTPEELEGMTAGERLNYNGMKALQVEQAQSRKEVSDLLGQVSDARSRSQMANTAGQATTDISAVVVQDRYSEPHRKPVNDIIVSMLEIEVVQALRDNPTAQISKFDIQRRFGEINATPNIQALLEKLRGTPTPVAPVTPEQAQQIATQRGTSVVPVGSGAPATAGDERPVTLSARRDRIMARFDNMVPRGQ